jgi:hypothetical protein
MEIVNAYAAVGTYRGAAALCGTTHKTVKRMLERRQAGQLEPRVPPPSNTAEVEGLIAKRVQATDGRISAKRLLPVARKAGYTGSPRNFRRAVAAAKTTWKRDRRTYRPWVPVPGEHLVFDWAKEAGRNLFCAVLAWSRYRFVRFGADQTRSTTLELLAECFEELDGVPAVILTDRMACLKAGIVVVCSSRMGLGMIEPPELPVGDNIPCSSFRVENTDHPRARVLVASLCITFVVLPVEIAVPRIHETPSDGRRMRVRAQSIVRRFATFAAHPREAKCAKNWLDKSCSNDGVTFTGDPLAHTHIQLRNGLVGGFGVLRPRRTLRKANVEVVV